MRKTVLLGAVAGALGLGLVATSAVAAPIGGMALQTTEPASLVEKVHFRRCHCHSGSCHCHRRFHRGFFFRPVVGHHPFFFRRHKFHHFHHRPRFGFFIGF
jgi:hypothetical protein